MPRNPKNPIWEDEANKKKFMELCKRSIKPSINWKKFHRLDEDNTFGELCTVVLSAQYRKYHYLEKGLCWKCRKREPNPDSTTGFCSKCLKYIKDCTKKSIARMESEKCSKKKK